MAEFSADSSKLMKYTGHRQELIKEVMEMKWKINGQEFYFGSSPVKVFPNPDKLDTLFYKPNKKARWDTIICNVTIPEKYQFVYNICCDGFNVRKLTNNKSIEGRVVVELNKEPIDILYLCTLGESGILPKSGVIDTLYNVCGSAMSTNIYWLTLKEIVVCKDSVNCTEETCLIESEYEVPKYDFGYNTTSTILNFNYMPLGNGILNILFDNETNEVIIK